MRLVPQLVTERLYPKEFERGIQVFGAILTAQVRLQKVSKSTLHVAEKQTLTWVSQSMPTGSQ